MPSHRYEIMFLTYQRRGIVARCLQSLIPVLLRDNVSWSVLDNCSTDGTANWLLNLKRTWPNGESFKLYLGTENLGVSGGRDFLLTQADASADIWVFLDSDVVAIQDDWLEQLTAILDSDETIGLTGPAGHWITVWPDGVWKWFEPVPPAFTGDIDTVSGYCQAFRSELARRPGFMDTEFGLYGCEDTASCLFLRNQGYTVWCSGDIGIRHLYANSSGDNNWQWKMQLLEERWRGKKLIRAEQ